VRNAVPKARLGSGHLAVCCHDFSSRIESNDPHICCWTMLLRAAQK
jgi:hypothetical protein